MKGDQKKLELTSGGRAPSSTGFLHEVSVLGTPLCHCCIRLQWMFFQDSFNSFAHFTTGDLRVHLPTPRWAFSSFLPKTHGPQAPHSLVTRPHPEWLFCFSRWKKSSKGNILPMWKRWNTQTNKKSRNTKRHQNRWVQKLFWAVGKNILIGVLHQMESTLKVTEV